VIRDHVQDPDQRRRRDQDAEFHAV
jgi:hypothetical protein